MRLNLPASARLCHSSYSRMKVMAPASASRHILWGLSECHGDHLTSSIPIPWKVVTPACTCVDLLLETKSGDGRARRAALLASNRKLGRSVDRAAESDTPTSGSNWTTKLEDGHRLSIGLQSWV